MSGFEFAAFTRLGQRGLASSDVDFSISLLRRQT